MKVNTNNSLTNEECKIVVVPTLLPPDNLLKLTDTDLKNKDYVIATLIAHIKSQNTRITENNKQASALYKIYTDCVAD